MPVGKLLVPHQKLLPIRIAICSVGELFGGVERHILGLLEGLCALNVEPLLILFQDSELAAQARAQGINPIIIPSQNRSLWVTSKLLARILIQHHIGTVHVHGYKAMVFCALARRWYSYAIVKTEHGLPEPMEGVPLRLVRDRVYHFLDLIATRVTGATVCYVTKELRIHHSRMHAGLRRKVIPNGVPCMDRTKFKYPPEYRMDWFNMAIVGRLDSVKGHHVAIEALATQTVPHKAHLQIIGTGPAENKLRELAKASGVYENVHFLGFRRNVYDYLAHCDIVLMPSLHEGLPYTLLEAMSLGKPIMASRVGGPMEVTTHGVNSFLFPVADATALGQGVSLLFDDPDFRKQLGNNARHLQRAEYSLHAMAMNYLKVYRSSVQSYASCEPDS